MGFLELHQKHMRKVKPKHLSLAMFGKALFVLILGSWFSIDLVALSYPLLALSAALILNYVVVQWTALNKKKPLAYGNHVLGVVGAFVLIFLFGLQSPQIPFKLPLLVVGVLMTFPGVKDVFWSK